MVTLKISARTFVLVFALNFFLCSGQHDIPQDIQKREDTINKLKCANMNNRILEDMTNAGVDVSRILCDNKTDGGGWIVIQRRIKGDVNFRRTWNDYKNGFGSNSGDFWIGNDVIYQLTNLRSFKGDVKLTRTPNDIEKGFDSNFAELWKGSIIDRLQHLGYNELRFDMKYEGEDYYAVHTGFKVENEAAKYRMNFTSFSGGNVFNGLIWHKGMKFTTIDSDNDELPGKSCAVEHGGGGWWYDACYSVNVNGEWASRVFAKGIHFVSITTDWSDSLDFVEMKLRVMK